MVQIEIPRVEEFMKELQKSWEQATNIMEEVVWQEKEEFLRIEGWQQHVARKQKYSFKPTLKEAGQQKIWTIQNLKGHWIGSI